MHRNNNITNMQFTSTPQNCGYNLVSADKGTPVAHLAFSRDISHILLK